jgi:hypothetical protein
VVPLSDVELLPRITETMAPATAVDLTATVPLARPSNRRGWLLAGAAGLVLVATTVAADIAGVVDVGVASLLGVRAEPYVELAMPAITPPAAAPALTPEPAPRSAAIRTAAPRASLTPAAPAAATSATPPPAPSSPPADPPNAAPAPAPPAPAAPEPAKSAAPEAAKSTAPPAVAAETVEKEVPAAPDTPVSRNRREVARLLLLAEAAESARDTNGALALYRQVLQLDAKNIIASRGVTRIRVDFLLRRAESQILVGDYEGALNDINTAMAEDPKNPRGAELREAIELGKKTRKPPR